MTASHFKSLVLVLIAFLAFDSYLHLGPNPRQIYDEPIRVYEVQIETPNVTPGGEAKFQYVMERRKSCASEVSDIWIDKFGEPVEKGEPVQGEYRETQPVHTSARITKLVPTNVSKGQQIGYSSYVTSRCSDGTQYAFKTPNVWFKVGDAKR